MRPPLPEPYDGFVLLTDGNGLPYAPRFRRCESEPTPWLKFVRYWRAVKHLLHAAEIKYP
jgi:hypothetical protein